MAGVLESLMTGMRAGSDMRQQQNNSRLAALAAQAYGAPADQRQGLVQQAIGLNPDGGFALGQNLQKSDDALVDGTLEQMRYATGAWRAGNRELAQGFYTRAAQGLSRMTGHQGLPQTMDDAAAEAFDKIVQSAMQAAGTNAELQTFQAMTQGLSPEDVQKARRIQLGLDGRASSAAIAYKVLKGADGRERLVAADPREPGAIVIGGEGGFGGGQQPAPMQQVQYATSDGQPIPPEDAAAFQAAIAANERGEQFNIPAGGPLPPRMDYQNGGFAGAFVSPSEAESAYNKERAQQQAQIDTLPTLNRLNAEGAALKESATGAAQTANAPGLKAGEEFGKEAGKAYAAIQEAGRSAAKERARLSQLRTLLQTTYTGPGANALLGIKRAANAFGFNVEGLGEAEAARALSNQLALSLRNPAGGEGMPGAMSDSDRAFLQQSVPSLSNSPQGWRAMVDMRLALADAAVKQARYAEQLRRQGVPIQDIPGMLQDFANQNPIFNGGAVASSQQRGGNASDPFGIL